MNHWLNISVFLSSFILALVSVLGVIRLCEKYDILDYPGLHKRHKRPTPNLGGAAIFISFWLVLTGLVHFKPGSVAEITNPFPFIIGGGVIIFLLGVIDDLHPLRAKHKLALEMMVGLILYLGGLKADWLSIPGFGSASLGHFSAVITILWVVGLTNAINVIDGLDGLASGVSFIAAVSMAIIGFLFGISSVVAISLTLAGAILAFWFFNRHPAKIFLGDGGSLLIGYIFAFISLIVPIKSFTAAALFLPLMVLGVPLIEIGSTFLRRFAAGKDVMKADRRHIFHYLAYLGLSQRQVVALFYLSGILLGTVAVIMFYFERILLLGLLTLFMVVIFILFFILMGKIRKENKPSRNGH